MNFRLILVAVCLIGASFLLNYRRPYSLASDIAYQAFSAQQYTENRVPAVNSLRLVNPRDLSRDVRSPLTFWAPAWAYLFVAAFKAGLTPGTAGRTLVILMSISGALGWLWVIGLAGLRGWWRIAAVVLTALYCLRAGVVFSLGTGDVLIYAVAPWLLYSSMRIAARLDSGLNLRLVAATSALCFALGCVYWLKYSGIFLGVPIFCAVALEHLRSRIPRVALIGVFALYAAAFAAPILANRSYNYRTKGTDLIESAAPRSKPRTYKRLRTFYVDTLFFASTTLFAPDQGMNYLTHGRGQAVEWMIRVPAVLLLIFLLYLLYMSPGTYLRNLTALVLVIPLLGFPVLSFISGPHFEVGFRRCCEPFWLLAELFVLMLLSPTVKLSGAGVRMARSGLAAMVLVQLALFLWIPAGGVNDLLFMTFKRPRYQAGAANLFIPDLSKFGTRQIDAAVKSQLAGPNDVIVPATYSNRSFGLDVWLEFGRREFGGRLMPLTTFDEPLIGTHGRDGASFYGTSPFFTSQPLRVIVVASNIFERPEFPAWMDRIKGRFTQAKHWNRGPLDPEGRVEIWTADLQP